MKRLLIAALAAVALSACTPSAPKPAADTAPPAPAFPAPRADLAQNFTNCTYGPVTGAGVTLGVFTCPGVTFQADETLPGIVRVFKAQDGETFTSPVIQVFPKAPEAPLDAVLNAVRKASPGAETCVFAEAPEGYRSEGRLVSMLAPTGEAKAKYDAFLAGKGKSDAPVIPCGPLGPGEAGAVTFEVRQEAPGKVLAIFWTSDLAPWDIDTLKVAP